MLYQGRGTEPDPAAAVIWFSQGARSGDVESRILYARALALGDGINADMEEAYYWTLMAAHNAHGEPVDDLLRDRLQAMLENRPADGPAGQYPQPRRLGSIILVTPALAVTSRH